MIRNYFLYINKIYMKISVVSRQKPYTIKGTILCQERGTLSGIGRRHTIVRRTTNTADSSALG